MTSAPPRDGNHDRRQADATAAVYDDPVSRAHLAEVDHRAVSGTEPAAEARRGVEVEIVRQRDQIDVGPVDRDQLRERARVREAGLEPPVAHLVVAATTGGAAAASQHERRGDAGTDGPAADVRTDLDRGAGELVARHVRETDGRVVTHPAMPVAAAEPGRRNGDDRALRWADRIRDGDDLPEFAGTLRTPPPA